MGEVGRRRGETGGGVNIDDYIDDRNLTLTFPYPAAGPPGVIVQRISASPDRLKCGMAAQDRPDVALLQPCPIRSRR